MPHNGKVQRFCQQVRCGLRTNRRRAARVPYCPQSCPHAVQPSMDDPPWICHQPALHCTHPPALPTQCNTFHVTERFEGGQRSCREQLARHAERRRELRRARREAEQGRSSPSSEGPHAASRRRPASSPQRYNSAPAPLPLSLVLPGQPAAPPIADSTQLDCSPPSKRQRAQSDALALLANMSVDQLHMPLPQQQQQQPQLQQSDTQSETLKLPALLPQLQAPPPPLQPTTEAPQGSPGTAAQQALQLPPLLRSSLASTESAATAAAGWAAQEVPLHPLTRAPSLPVSSGNTSLDVTALATALASAAQRQAAQPAPALSSVQGPPPSAPPQADLVLMLQQVLGQNGGLAPAPAPLPPQADLQAMLLGQPPGGQSLGQLNAQMDSALLQLRQQAAQQLLMLDKKQRVLRRTMDVLQHVMQQPAAGAPPPLAPPPSGSLETLQLLALLQQQPQAPQPQTTATQQQNDALLRMLGLTQPPQ